MSSILQIAAIAAATLGTGAATLTVMNRDIPDLEVPAGDWAATGALDGRAFRIAAKDLDSGAALDNVIHFGDGGFQSADCQTYCDFGWSEYRTREVAGGLQFTVTTLCPDAPHTVVWHGTVTGEDMVVDLTWTTRRWYWTNQIRARGTGIGSPEEGTPG